MEHITRFNKTDEGEAVKRTKQEKQEMFRQLALQGPKIVIDLDFEKLQTEKEVKSLCQQVCFCTNINKQAKVPMNLVLSGVGGQIRAQLEKQNCKNWPVTIHTDSYSNHFAKNELVYLTADSEHCIEELDSTKTYIIGGIVDRNRYKNLTLKKAMDEGIAHAKLPIGELMKLKSNTVLTVNHVFDILCEWYQWGARHQPFLFVPEGWTQ